MKEQYRQGDILLVKVDGLPDLTFKIKKDKVILKGELSGHAHRLKGNAKILEEAEDIISVNPKDSTLQWTMGAVNLRQPKSQVIGYAVVDAPAELTHEDHIPPIVIPAGVYQIRRQREYDEKEIRFVED